jgi:hypothetical protein
MFVNPVQKPKQPLEMFAISRKSRMPLGVAGVSGRDNTRGLKRMARGLAHVRSPRWPYCAPSVSNGVSRPECDGRRVGRWDGSQRLSGCVCYWGSSRKTNETAPGAWASISADTPCRASGRLTRFAIISRTRCSALRKDSLPQSCKIRLHNFNSFLADRIHPNAKMDCEW